MPRYSDSTLQLSVFHRLPETMNNFAGRTFRMEYRFLVENGSLCCAKILRMV